MTSGFMLYRCDFEKANPLQNQHWFYHSFERAIERFQTLLIDDVIPNYNNPGQYDVFVVKKEKVIKGSCHILFHSDDEMIWIEAISFSD